MKLKNYIKISFIASAVFLTACSQNSPEAMHNNSTEVADQQDELVTQFNQLFETESSLQDVFEETLNNDPELETFSDESSPVFDNIDQRRDLITSIEEISNEINSNAQNFVDYDGEELPTEDVNSLGDSLVQLNDSISEYTSSYSTALDNEESYFTSISADEADYQQFIDGINTINEEQETLQENAVTIDEQLAQTRQETSDLIQVIEEVQNQEEE